jgi:membrane fusion protein, multidrug efflux system
MRHLTLHVPDDSSAAPSSPRLRLLRALLLIAVPAAAIALALHWYAKSARWAETDNAYVKAQVIAISAEVAGRVAEVPVKDQQRVERGAALFRLDPVPFQLAVSRAAAQLAVTRTEIETLRSDYRGAHLDAEEAAERVPFLARQFERQRLMKEKGMSREDLYDEAQNNLETAKKHLMALRERANRALASLDGKPDAALERHPRFLQALAARDQAVLDLERTRVSAPVAGVLSNMKLQPGEYVERGAAKFSLVEDGPLWVEANFKETQLTDMREGQPVSFTADAYPGASWRARVATIAPATGAEFAVLPPQNATGNWVKVVQRVPVRIAIEETGKRPPLRAGMTVSVTVDTGRERSASDLLRDLFSPARAHTTE